MTKIHVALLLLIALARLAPAQDGDFGAPNPNAPEEH